MKFNDPHQIILRPIVTEKSDKAQQRSNQYTFQVALEANKIQIGEAVERIWGVRVKKVRTINMKPKPRRRGWVRGRTRMWKKAIVTLAEGETIEIV
ncbi:MAG: 50S ribosomal protein L23 [Planctomycetota bacterium]|nr:50S ribosomal protein L23 [Planctomycetota bacterium]